MAAYLDRAAEIVFLDLGANVGAASRYFLETFPRARVIAVEPDSGNILMCHKNLAPYGDRVQIIQAAVWGRNTRLIFEEDSTEAGVEAGVRVREPFPDEDLSASVAAIDVPSLLLDRSVPQGAQIAMKIDVEGSEEEIFSGSCLDWLDRVSCIAIELHDSVRKNCSRNFFSAIKGRQLEPPEKIGDTLFAHLKTNSGVAISK